MLPPDPIQPSPAQPRRLLARSCPAAAALALALAWTATPALAQTVEPKPEEKVDETAEDQVVELSPFEVTTNQDKGYAATSSLAGSRLNTELRDIGAAVQVITPEFAKDLGATDVNKLLVYTTNTEVAGVGGNYYGGDTGNKGTSRSMLTDPHRTARIRGLNDADLTRQYFPSDVPMDWYNMARVDISRGSNSILFGLGSPAGLINNTLKTPNLSRNAYSAELRAASHGSLRESVDLDQTLVPGQLGVRITAVNDEAKFRQDFTFNHDKRVYGALRWQPRLTDSIFTQIDVQAESGRIVANRPIAGTPSDFLSDWYGLANKLAIPTDEYWAAPGFIEDLTASQTLGGQLWDDHPVSFFSDPSSGAVSMPGNAIQAMLLRGAHNVNGGGWGSWAGLRNPNWVGHASHPKNSKSYYANHPTLAPVIAAYETQTGRTFRGFGQGMWPLQMIVDGPIADMAFDQNLIGPNKGEFNDFDVLNLEFTQTYLDGRLGINAAYTRQHYSSGYTNLMEGLWNMNMVSVDINQTLRGSTTPNPNYGRPFTIGEGRGGIFERDRENWRVTGFGLLKAEDFFDRESWLARILGEHTLTGVKSSQHFENFDRYYALYRWQPEYIKALNGRDNRYATWRGLHYLGPSLLNTTSFSDATIDSGVRTLQAPALTQNVWYDKNGTWTQQNFNLLSAETDRERLYDGASGGYDDTRSTVFVWQGKMFNNILVPIFGWREDTYTRWNKSSDLERNDDYDYVEPFNPDWTWEDDGPSVYAKQQRRSWSIALHGKELMEVLGHPLPRGMDITLLYNDASSFRPSDVAVDVYNREEPLPSGNTKDWSVMVSAFDNRVSLRVTKYETKQASTPYFGPAPDWGWTKANLSRSMNGMMWEVGEWAGADPTTRVQPTPEWLVNRWMFGDSYDKTIAAQPLPANWASDPNILKQPLRIRRSAVPGSPTYVAQGTPNPNNSGLPYVAPPLEADEVAYREQWFKARTDAEWSRPVDQAFWSAMDYTRDYGAAWGGFWEPDAWQRPQNQRHLNHLTSEGTEYEVTANPTRNWRISFNASRAEAVRSNVLTSWDEYIQANKEFYFDGGYDVGDTPAADYWSFKGYYDIPHTPGNTLGVDGRMGTQFNNTVYNPYYQAKATADQAVQELRKWHFNLVNNYTFTQGFLKNVGVGAAVRWQDRSLLGYTPKFDADANSWVIDLSRPIMGPTETNYDAWISYERKLGRGLTWSVQLNVYDLFAEDDLIPTAANPDGTIAQVRVPNRTSWAVTNTIKF